MLSPKWLLNDDSFSFVESVEETSASNGFLGEVTQKVFRYYNDVDDTLQRATRRHLSNSFRSTCASRLMFSRVAKFTRRLRDCGAYLSPGLQ